MIKILVIIILIVLLIENNSNVAYEHFKNNIPINFIDTIDFNNFDYLDKFNSGDVSSRRLNGDIVDVYNKSIVKANEDQKNTCYEIVNSICTKVNSKYINEPWNIAVFKNIENGFPHTHNQIILFPVDNVALSEDNKITFLHEKIHNIQKKHPHIFTKLYEDYWGFRRCGDINIPFQCRTNPDTPNINWTFQDHMLLVKYNDKPRNLNDVTYVGYNLKTKNVVELKKWKKFADYFGVGNINYYHPDEISATMISNYYFNYKEPTPAFKQMVKWCRDYL